MSRLYDTLTLEKLEAVLLAGPFEVTRTISYHGSDDSPSWGGTTTIHKEEKEDGVWYIRTETAPWWNPPPWHEEGKPFMRRSSARTLEELLIRGAFENSVGSDYNMRRHLVEQASYPVPSVEELARWRTKIFGDSYNPAHDEERSREVTISYILS